MSTQKKEWPSSHENDGQTKYGGRDVAGYGGHPPQPHWPKGAKVALNFVINYEEGGESCILHGDGQSEHLLSDVIGATPQGTSLAEPQKVDRKNNDRGPLALDEQGTNPNWCRWSFFVSSLQSKIVM